jgi:AcrR family transcriptional regulator
MSIVTAVRTPRLPAQRRRSQLLDVTKEVVGREGFHAVTIEGVARLAGVSRPVVYEHFGDLAGLLEALIDRLAADALAQLASVLPSDLEPGRPRAALLAALRGYLEAAAADPVTWRLVLMPPEGAPVAARERIAAGRALVVEQLADAVGPAFAAGRALPDAEMTARLMVTVADELVRLVLTEPDAFPVERVLAHADWVLSRLEPGAAIA